MLFLVFKIVIAFSRVSIAHVSRSQFRQVLSVSGILLSDEEMYALERRFNDDMGFHYSRFLNEVDPREYAIPKVCRISVHRIKYT